MLIKLTESCSMGCNHCMNDAKPCDRHMTMETLNHMMDFLIENEIYKDLIISGGEPTEHPEFMSMIRTIINRLKTDPRSRGAHKIVTITTNGVWCESHYDETKEIVEMGSSRLLVTFQVSNDSRYYPKRIDLDNPVFKLFGVVPCIDEHCVQQIYPQGRARNFEKWEAKCSKCFNVRAIAKQLAFKNIRFPMLKDIVKTLENANKFCTPAIHYNGGIGLGESDLCPIVATIFDSDKTIVNNILHFECHACDFINAKLPELHRFLIQPLPKTEGED